MNTIKLEIDKNLIAVAGYEFGKDIAEKQIVDKLDEWDMNEIQFPEHVEMVAEGCTLSGIYGAIYNKYPDFDRSKIKIILLSDGRDISRKDNED